MAVRNRRARSRYVPRRVCSSNTVYIQDAHMRTCTWMHLWCILHNLHARSRRCINVSGLFAFVLRVHTLAVRGYTWSVSRPVHVRSLISEEIAKKEKRKSNARSRRRNDLQRYRNQRWNPAFWCVAADLPRSKGSPIARPRRSRRCGDLSFNLDARLPFHADSHRKLIVFLSAHLAAARPPE